LRALEEAPHRFDLFAALRQLECLHPGSPRIGEASRPAEEPVRIGQVPSLAFAPATVAEFKSGTAERPSYLATYYFGVFGPNGPLPLHLSEYAHGRELNNHDASFRRFADIFHHRLASLFYRAWADAQPAVSLDRPEPRFDLYIGSLVGRGGPELRGRDSVADDAKLGRAGRFALAVRPPQGLIGILEDYFGLPFTLLEQVGEWLPLERKHRLALGERNDASALGSGTMLGKSVWSCQHAFRLICGPLSFSDFAALLPGEPRLTHARDLVRNYSGDELKWTLNLVLLAAEVPKLELGRAGKLGWSTWLGTRASAAPANEVVIDPDFLAARA
jgi:type VI secretion system protein ImpH